MMLCGQHLPATIDALPHRIAWSRTYSGAKEMLNPPVQRSMPSITQRAGRRRRRHQENSLTWAIRWRHTVRNWIARSRQRTDLSEMAERNDDLLKDIGVSPESARREAAKPFWQR
jgi:uncharacterized protein YjiS (DUF1127 family)